MVHKKLKIKEIIFECVCMNKPEKIPFKVNQIFSFQHSKRLIIDESIFVAEFNCSENYFEFLWVYKFWSN